MLGHCGVHHRLSTDPSARQYEAALAVLLRGFRVHGFERVWAVVHRDNLASRRLCEKLGMREEPAEKEETRLFSIERASFCVPVQFAGRIELAPP